MPSKILGPDGKPLLRDVPDRPLKLRSKFDAAGQGADNRKHWAQADLLSAKSANSLDVRQKLRSRSRYEYSNNGYANGLIVTMAHDIIGTGPTLQCELTLEDGEPDDANNDIIETRFYEWAEAAGFVSKLQTKTQAKKRDGEGLGLFRTNRKLDDGVKLDLMPFETDQLTSPQLEFGSEASTDGIQFDEAGNPTRYHILNEHPGDTFTFDRAGTWIPAERVIHWFRKDRPGQVRGVPEITPALNLFAQLRRYTLATLIAAETAAEFAAVLKAAAPPEGAAENTDEDAAFEEFPIARGMMTQLPEGWDISQFKPEQPVNTYEMFKRELLKEIGRAVNVPFNVIAGDSSLYNFSSARLDMILFYRGAICVERDDCRKVVLERVFYEWYREARLVPGYLPAGLPDRIPHSWNWPGFSSIDPLKEALADQQNLINGTVTLKQLVDAQNGDYEKNLKQLGKEAALRREMGLPVPGEKPADPNATDQALQDEPTSPARQAYINGFFRVNGRHN